MNQNKLHIENQEFDSIDEFLKWKFNKITSEKYISKTLYDGSTGREYRITI